MLKHHAKTMQSPTITSLGAAEK